MTEDRVKRGSEEHGNLFTPVVLTYRRPRIAERTVRHLINDEGVAAEDVVLVVNGDGGLEDRTLESRLDVVRLDRNVGPAAGFRAGLQHAIATRDTPWIYVMEDDVGLLELPHQRALRVTRLIASQPARHRDVGAVVAYGRMFVGQTGRSVPHVPNGEVKDLVPVDVAAWGATLIRREVLESGILPDAGLFFGYEDFDFFLRMQRAGWRVVVDVPSERAVMHQVTDQGRVRTFARSRPSDRQERWREYYRARNFLVLQRRWGSWRWAIDHFGRSLRRLQLAGWDPSVAMAIARGLRDGVRGRVGPSVRYQRELGEYSAP